MKRLIFLFLFCAAAFARYEPFPIYDMRTGRVTAQDPWLLPKDAFETLNNCHLKDGVLEKRLGYSFFGQMLEADTTTKNPTLNENPIMGLFNWYSGSTEELLIMDQDRISKYVTNAITNVAISGVVQNGGDITCTTTTSHGLAVGDMVTITGTTDYNGTFDVTAENGTTTFDVTDTFTNTQAGTANQEPFNDLTTSKIRFTYYDNVSTLNDVQVHVLILGDTLTGADSGATATVIGITIDTGTWAGTNVNGVIHLSDLDTGSDQTGTFGNSSDEDITDGVNVVGHVWSDSGDEEFDGDNTQFFWVENWKEVSYFTNDNDQMQKYDGSFLSRQHIDLGTAGGVENDVTRVLLVFALKSRIVIFNVDEEGATHRSRARWSDINDPDTWKAANYVDAPTDEWIVAADFIGDELIIFFERSVWKFSYTGDADLPFRWDKIDSVEGCYATMSLVSFSDEIIAVGATQLIATDGREAYTIDQKIPDMVLEWAPGSVAYSYGIVLDEMRQAWITYASASASAHTDGNIYTDKVVILNYDDESYATYDLPAHVLGYSALESDVTWNSVTDAWEDIDWSWNDRTKQAGYPTSLMGSTDGMVYQINSSGADSGSDIEFSAVTGRWNPYKIQEARLGWVDFLVDADAGESFSVEFYLNSEASSYQTSTIECTDTGTSRSKVWKRAECGAIAEFHRLNITNDASANTPRIHAIVPYFKPGGSLF